MCFSMYYVRNKIWAVYGHELALPPVHEFVKIDGVVVRDAINGRDEDAIY